MLLESIPDYVSVRTLRPMTEQEKRDHETRMRVTVEQMEAEKAQRVHSVKEKLGLSDAELELLKGIFAD